MTTNLERRFDTAMMSIYDRAKTEAKYNANVFLGMLNDRGGLATARYLINATSPSEGYTNLAMGLIARPPSSAEMSMVSGSALRLEFEKR